MTPWPFRSRLRKALFAISVAIMLAAAVVGLVAALVAGEFTKYAIAALTAGLGALLIIVSLVIVEQVSRKFHPESGLFAWSDVDMLRELAIRMADDTETREWAKSLADRIAVVLPGRDLREVARGNTPRVR